MSEIYEDAFGNEYVLAEGEIKVGDMALNGDTGDVIIRVPDFSFSLACITWLNIFN